MADALSYLEGLWDDLMLDLGLRKPQGPPLPAPLPPPGPSASDFDVVIQPVLLHEGGLVDDPADPGGLTNMGITLRDNPELGAEGIRNLTVAQAKTIYFQKWWLKYGWSLLPMPEAGKVLDLGVNMGPKNINECLQLALQDCGHHELAVDGEIGSKTVMAAQASDPVELMKALREHAISHYTAVANSHPALRRFLAGWINRVNS